MTRSVNDNLKSSKESVGEDLKAGKSRGEVTMEVFQSMFKAALEKTSSHPADLNYTIWKAMARSDYLSSFLCILISLPFVYGFANDTWTNVIDVMLEKKPGDC